MAKKHGEAGSDVQTKVQDVLNKILLSAESIYTSDSFGKLNLTTSLQTSLETISSMSMKASTGFTNIVTCLAIKVAYPNVDIRYHQVQIQDQTPRAAGFNFRGVSEKTVYPWLSFHAFEGAKSGWQTRTFERPKPYMLTYDENIGDIKNAFLNIFNEIEENCQSATDALTYILVLQLRLRDSKNIVLSIPKTKDIQLIVQIFNEHFFNKYKSSKGASRLPVLALYAIYSVLMAQLERYRGCELKPLEEHSAADSQTGAIGDIEVIVFNSGEVFEAVEVKHDIMITDAILQDTTNKIMDRNIDRYYILTTHRLCEPNAELVDKIAQIRSFYNCQVIVNGVLPSIKYYLRLLSDPSQVFPVYVELLKTDKAIKHEHREVWNKLALRG